MSRLKPSPVGYWNEEKCREVAMGCKSIEEFRKAFEGRAYVNSRKRGLVKTLTLEMYDNGYWTLPDRKPRSRRMIRDSIQPQESCPDHCQGQLPPVETVMAEFVTFYI